MVARAVVSALADHSGSNRNRDFRVRAATAVGSARELVQHADFSGCRRTVSPGCAMVAIRVAAVCVGLRLPDAVFAFTADFFDPANF